MTDNLKPYSGGEITPETHYGGKLIVELSDANLIQIVQNLNNIEAERDKASQHSKFKEDRIVNGKMLKKMEFPPLTENYLKMKQALVSELEKRNIKEWV